MESNGNKLVEVSYKYDHENNKLTRECDGNVIYYMYDFEGKLLYEKSDTTCRSYVYLGTRLIGFYEGENQYYAITDETGSVRKICEGETEVWCGTYSPFGKLMSTEGDLEFTALFGGKEIDADTGLTYHWNRWRNEDGNAFISEDPQRDGYNWYGYVNANPFRYVDSNGLESYVCRDGTFCSEGDLSNPSYRADCYHYNGYNSGTLASMSGSAYSLYNNGGQATLALSWTSASRPSAAEEIKNCGNIGVENVIRGKITDSALLVEKKDELDEKITEFVVGVEPSGKITIYEKHINRNLMQAGLAPIDKKTMNFLVEIGLFSNWGNTGTHNLIGKDNFLSRLCAFVGGKKGTNTDYRGIIGTVFEGCQFVYDLDGNLVIDSKNKGTFDTESPQTFNGAIKHFFADVVTWLIWGNGPPDELENQLMPVSLNYSIQFIKNEYEKGYISAEQANKKIQDFIRNEKKKE